MARKTRQPLTRTSVIEAAMNLADHEGLSGLSMRRLGKEVGVEAMSLYHHLPGKEGLLDGLAEALATEITAAVEARPVEVSQTWKSDLRSRCLAARTVVLQHPWTPALFAARQSVPFAMYVYIDSVVGLLVEAGFSYQIAHRALHALGSLLFGFAQEMFSPPTSGGNLDPAQAQAEYEGFADQLPNIAAMVASEIHQLPEPTMGWCDSQTEFEFTLDLLLDGLERLLH